MPKILIASCTQEISSFNPVLSGYQDFGVLRGDDILKYHRTVGSEVGGALKVFDARKDVTLVPTYAAGMLTCGGTLAAAAFTRIATEFLQAIKEAPLVDGIYFCLHGAMSAENEPDPEGYLLAETRKIVGEKVPIVISCDLHGIFTDRMCRHADAVVSYQTYPHIDFVTTGERSAKLLLRIVAGECKPVTAKVDIPALVRGDELITETGLIRHVIEVAGATERGEKGLSAGMFWSNPFTDVPDLCTTAFAVTDNDPARAEKAALQMADIFWTHHETMRVPLTSLADAARIACDQARIAPEPMADGTVVLVDAADATSSGASGDSNALMRALMDAGFKGTALIPIVDEPAVKAAFAAGVGNTVRTNVGGALDHKRFRPIAVEGRVHMLSEGLFRSEKTRDLWNSGPTAVVVADGYTLILISRPVHLFDRALFYAHGQDPQTFDAVVVKSPNCEPHMFRAWGKPYVDVDAPGSTSANLKSLGHTRIKRPMFPLDENVVFVPRATLFSRP